MLRAAYAEQQDLLDEVTEQSSCEHEPFLSNDTAQQNPKQASPMGSPNSNSKSAYMLLATQMMCDIGSVMGEKLAAGEVNEREVYKAAADYLSKFPRHTAKTDQFHLPDCSGQMGKSFGENTVGTKATENGDNNSQAKVRNQVDDQIKEKADDSVENAMGDACKEVKKEQIEVLQDPVAEHKGKPFSCGTMKVGEVEKSIISARMIYDEGTNVDTGLTERTDIPPNYVFEINEAFSQRKTRKQPEKKSSWWKTGAVVVGAGLVGYGIYKYFSQ